MDMDVMQRYMHGWRDMTSIMANQGYWTYRMVNSPRQLEEKICLFWHGILCVGDSKFYSANQLFPNHSKTHPFVYRQSYC